VFFTVLGAGNRRGEAKKTAFQKKNRRKSKKKKQFSQKSKSQKKHKNQNRKKSFGKKEKLTGLYFSCDHEVKS